MAQQPEWCLRVLRQRIQATLKPRSLFSGFPEIDILNRITETSSNGPPAGRGLEQRNATSVAWKDARCALHVQVFLDIVSSMDLIWLNRSYLPQLFAGELLQGD